MSRIARFGVGALGELGAVLAEAGIERAVLVTTERGAQAARGLPVVGSYVGVRPHVPVDTVAEAAAMVESLDVDGIVAFGGGSAIDTAKAAVARLATKQRGELPKIVAIPTTYAGAEWTHFFGLTLAPGRKGGGADERARPVAAIYDPELTLSLPLTDTVGTAMNALAHCAEAFYYEPRNDDATLHAARGAAAIASSLPRVVENGDSLDDRTLLLEGAMEAAFALGESGVCLGHAMAQGLGGRYGLPQGAMNALCLPVALRFNGRAVPRAIAQFAAALGVEDAAARVEKLARLGGFARLRDFGIPESELGTVAAAIAERAGARANPRPAEPEEIAELLQSIW